MRRIIKSSEAEEEVKLYRPPDGLEELSEAVRRQKALTSHHYKNGDDEVLSKALKQSEIILNTARDEGELIKASARKEGFEIGFEEGKKAGYDEALRQYTERFEADREKVKAQVIECISEMELKKQELLDKYLEDLKNTAIAVAEKVIQVSLKSSGDIVKRMIVAATDKLKKTEWAKIYISKYDAELMTEGDGQLLNSLSYLSDNIKIITMDQEEQGTCIVELPDEIIDVSVNTQVENIKDILNNAHI